VYGENEVPAPPQPANYSLGTFVRIAEDSGSTGENALVGIVYNTMLVNPDFGTLGPRLSQRSDIEVFSPDYLSETATLLGLVAVGWRDASGRWNQGPPLQAAMINGEVVALDDREFVHFHTDAAGRPALTYAPTLLAMQSPAILPLLLHIVDRLLPYFPAHGRTLGVLRNNLAWRRVVEPAR